MVVLTGTVGSSAVEASQLSEQLRRELLRYLSATSEERARLIGEPTQRNPGMAELLADLEVDDTLRDRFELELLRSLGT
jgi:hypothetical protein